MLAHPKAVSHRRDGMPLVAWTIRDPAEALAIKDSCDNLIFEGFAA
jgi:hypothetical protein